MDDSDGEILGISNEKRKIDARSPVTATVHVSNSSKKTVKDKLKETEVYHHHTALAKSSHTKKKRRKSHAERSKGRNKHEKAKIGQTSEFQRHIQRAQHISTGKSDQPLAMDTHQPTIPQYITQNRITTGLGMYNKAKKSENIHRGNQDTSVKIPVAVRDAARQSLQHILDVSEANIPPAPDPDLPLMLHTSGNGTVQRSHPKPQIQIDGSKSTAEPRSSHQRDSDVELPSYHQDELMEVHVDYHPASESRSSLMRDSPQLSPVSDAAQMIHSSFSLSSTFPGRGYFAEVKDSLLKQLHKQKQSSALQTPRKSHIQVEHHSSVRKNLNLDFARRSASGGVRSRSRSAERNVQHGDVVRRSHTQTKVRNHPLSSEMPRPVGVGLCPSASGSVPGRISDPEPEKMNLFEECALTLQQHPPPHDVPMEEFIPRVEAQMLPHGHAMDMLDYVELTCSNNDSFTQSDSHSTVDTISHRPHPHYPQIEAPSTLIYPTHLDPSCPIPRKTHYKIEHYSREQGKEAKYMRERFEKSSSSSEDSPTSWFPTLPPAPLPVLPPTSPSPPALFRQRMY